MYDRANSSVLTRELAVSVRDELLVALVVKVCGDENG